MRHYVLLVLFIIGLVLSIVERIQFEYKKKKEKDEDYCDLFRRYNTLLTIILIYLSVQQGCYVYYMICSE